MTGPVSNGSEIRDVSDPLVGTTDDSAVQTLRHRAGASALLVGLRGFLIKGVALGGTLVFARLLSPSDFGLVALGTSFIAVGRVLSDAGLGPALIQRPEAPRAEELGSVLGCGLAVAAVVVAAAVVLALSLGRVGEICLVMALAVPVAVLKSPSVIRCERALNYSPLVFAEVGEVLAYNLWGLATVLSGLGVWGLASAAVAQAATGSALVTARLDGSLPRPNLRLHLLRSMLRFGLQFQAVPLVLLARDQGINLGTALVAGTATLGIWNLAFRIMQVPFLIIEALWRVSYPAMARLREAGDDLGAVVERAGGLAAVAAAALLAPLAASAHVLIPALFGDQWGDAASVVVFSSIGLGLAGPVAVASGGYLYAIGRAGTVLRAAALSTVVWLAVAFALLSPIGVSAIGVGWLAGSLVEAALMGAPTVRLTRARLVGAILPALVVSSIAGTGGWLVAMNTPNTLFAGLAIAVGTLAVYLAALPIVARRAVRDAAVAVRAFQRRHA